MNVMLKKKFIPTTEEEITDVKTILFTYLQIVSENFGCKKLCVSYLKRDGEGCIFDEVQDLLKTVTIELDVTPRGLTDFFDFSMLNDPPHLVYVDDLINDPVASEAMVTTVPPTCYLINREALNAHKRLREQTYHPLYKMGQGKDKLLLSRWNFYETWKHIKLQNLISLLTIRSESDLKEMDNALKRSSKFNPLIVVSKYPDNFGVKEKVLEFRMWKRVSHISVVLTNSEVEETAIKERFRNDLACSILNDGIWGGEYYLPA